MNKRKRGEQKDGLLFWRYKKGREQWVTEEKYILLAGQKVAWTKANLDRVRAVNKKSAILHADVRRARARERGYTPEQATKRRDRGRLQYQENRVEGASRIRLWRYANLERSRELVREYRERHPDKVNAMMNRRAKERRATDAVYALASRLRTRIKQAVTLKCSSKYPTPSRSKDREAVRFLQWLAEYKSLGEAYWTRYAIDHLIPVVWWKANRPEELELMNAPENVRWLTPSENSKKSASMPSQDEINTHLKLVAEWRATLSLTAQEDKIVSRIQKVE